MPELLLALDAGTTGVRALLVDAAGTVLGLDKQRIESRYPAPGECVQDAAAVWHACGRVMAGALAAAGRAIGDVAAIGVTTQRSSVVLWDRETGAPAAPLLVWSDLRGRATHRALQAAGFPSWPQVPATKLPAALAMADRPVERLRWGTLDSWLVDRLSGGAAHVTDRSCAWVSGYLDYAKGDGWNPALLEFQNIPASLFPTLVDSWGALAVTDPAVMGAAVPITALLADQQAGMVAHGALDAGDWKVTYGTSAVLMVGTGPAPFSPHETMPVEALGHVRGQTRYCAEGMVITAGSTIEWLCDGLGLFPDAAALEAAAASVPDTGGVLMRPSFQGLGVPHGRFGARGLVAGLSFATQPAHLARAALTGIACRIREIATIMADRLDVPAALPVDGGLSNSATLLQIQADLLQRPVQRHAVREATAYGAALAAGLGLGLFDESALAGLARYDATFEPAIGRDAADEAFAAWSAAAGSAA